MYIIQLVVHRTSFTIAGRSSRDEYFLFFVFLKLVSFYEIQILTSIQHNTLRKL